MCVRERALYIGTKLERKDPSVEVGVESRHLLPQLIQMDPALIAKNFVIDAA